MKEKNQYIGQGDDFLFDHSATICSYVYSKMLQDSDATAVLTTNHQLTFKKLLSQSNQLAHHLIKEGVKPEDKVAFYLEPGLHTIISILAILQTGACFIPIDITYPKDRIAFMLEDSNAKTLITKSTLKKQLNIQIPFVLLDEAASILSQYPIEFTSLAKSSFLAYIIYTSGSTGVPKGVQITHQALLNHMLWISHRFEITEEDKLIQKTPLSFDPAIWEVFLPFFTGAQLLIAPRGSNQDPEALIELITQYKITMIQLVPSILEQLLHCKNSKACSTLRYVFVGGESLRTEIKELFFNTLDCTLINLYGPTEATIDITSHNVYSSKSDLQTNIIGRPIYNTSLYVVNSEGELAGLGEEGELYIGSLSLASGYYHRDELTKKQFIENPFDPHRFKTLYKTGDLVRWLPDGELEYLGRNNDQVKINGVRIEPKGIILNVLKHEDVADCFIIKKKDSHGYDYLACYLKAKDKTINIAKIKQTLKNKYPSYMIPRVFIVIDTIPVTLNGKVDIKALPEPNFTQNTKIPANDDLSKLMLLWQEVLETNEIDIHDNFFDIGGASLLALKLITLVEKNFNVSIKIRDLYTYPTLIEQMNIIKLLKNPKSTSQKLTKELPNPLICLQAKGDLPPLFLIHPIGGTIFWFSSLARYLGTSRPIYGIQDPGIDIQKPVLNSIEEMADFYLQHIKMIQPKGPYLIGGASFGATVAASISHKLKEKNDELSALIVLDGWGVYPSTLLDDNYFKLSMERQHADLMTEFKKFNLPDPKTLFAIQWFRLELLWKFQMQQINFPIALFKSKELMPAFAAIDEPNNHWEKFSTQPIHCFNVPGNHETMFQEPHVLVLAEELNKFINKKIS